jgi:hypothetical protein
MLPLFWFRSTGFGVESLLALALPDGADRARFEEHMPTVREALVRTLTAPAAAEAIIQSSPEGMQRIASLAAVARQAPNSRTRQRFRLAWNYMQRLHIKNETSSFFGPLAWGRVDPDAQAALELSPVEVGGRWLRRSRVRIEPWVIDRLSAVLRSHEDLLETQPLRLDPRCDLVAEVLHLPLGRTTTLGADTADVLRRVMSGQLLSRREGGHALRRLARARVVSGGPDVPPGAAEPLHVIDAELKLAGAEARPLRNLVADIEFLRTRYEAARPEQRQRVMTELVNLLEEMGISTDRPTGRMYVGRFPLYEDCERNLTLVLGRPLLDILETWLAPLMRLYRVAGQVAAARLNERYARVLAGAAPDEHGDMDLVGFIHAVHTGGVLHRELVEELQAELAALWLEQVPTGTATAELCEEDLNRIAVGLRRGQPDHVRFGNVLGVGLVSPDLLLAAPDLAAVRAGLVRVDIGEVHPGVPMAMQPVALQFLDDTQTALDWANRLLAPGRVQLAASSVTYHRSCVEWPVVPHLWEVVLPGAASRCPPDRQIPIGRGRVVLREGIVTFTDRPTGRMEDIVSLLSSDLQRVLFAIAGDVLGAAVPQRLSFGDVRVKRRSWTFGVGGADVDRPPDARHPAEDYDDYMTFVRWALKQGLPRHVFFRASDEPKPIYMDLRNPLSVDAFAKQTRKPRTIVVTEMSPAPGELWFEDANGHHTSELRTTFCV